MPIKVNVLGSCVSRVPLLDGNQSGHGIADARMSLDYFLDKQNIVLAMMPSPFSREEVNCITDDELWDKSRLRTLQQALNKDTIDLLIGSEAEYLIMDLFDFQNAFAVLGNTAIDTVAFEFMNTALYRKYRNDIKLANFFQMPEWVYYPYVDLFFKAIMKKYDSEHIIFNRFRANKYYLAKNGEVKIIPDCFKKVFQANEKYNNKLRKLEDYIIKKYQPYVIDITKYYMGNENDWKNLQGAHFEKAYYHHNFNIIKEIILNKSPKKVWDEYSFFNKRYEENYSLDVEKAMVFMNKMLMNEDMLFFNLLDKLYHRVPDDQRIRPYLTDMKVI